MNILRILLILSLPLLVSCKLKETKNGANIEQKEAPEEIERGLKDYYADYFPIGVAISPNSLQAESKKLILRQFNSVTAENTMKMGPIHPEQNRYNWGPADKIAAFAKNHDLKIRGHNLIWHQQTGEWIFNLENGGKVNRDELLKRMKTHIDSVVGRYKGQIYAWDVVNEAIADDSTQFLRKSLWYNIIGEDFIAKAFEYAHHADPEAKLFYNDYNAVIPQKRDRIYKLLKNLKAMNVPIDGVGIQGHWSVFGPSEKELRKAIEMYSSLGLDVQITELDVSIYPGEKERRDLRPGESNEFTSELQQKQIEKYDMFFRVFRDFKNVITGVTFWNVSDRHSWLDNHPVVGRKNYPLLFDQDLKPKKAYWKVVDFDKKQRTTTSNKKIPKTY